MDVVGITASVDDVVAARLLDVVELDEDGVDEDGVDDASVEVVETTPLAAGCDVEFALVVVGLGNELVVAVGNGIPGQIAWKLGVIVGAASFGLPVPLYSNRQPSTAPVVAGIDPAPSFA